jgi:transglutaminase-like putative cysteine protease
MRLTVRHETAYRYAHPIPYAIQTLRLTPRPHDGLTVLRWRVQSETRRPLPSFTDGFGNLTHTHAINRLHQSAAILVEGEVETWNTDGLVRGVPEPLPPPFFQRATALTAPHPAIDQLAHAAAAGGSPRDQLLAVMTAVRAKVDYRTGVTDAKTTAAEALANGAGVCQDHAHLFIAAARSLGVPARYVGGYLWTGENGREYQASHAWAEAFIADLGWVGFDAANGVSPNEAYIRTSVGLDYWSAAPVRGVRRGDAAEALTVSVRVGEAAEQ